MRIFIPTRGRIKWQTTRRYLFLDDMPYEVTYVVPESEARLWANDGTDLIVPDDWKFSDIRQHILRQPMIMDGDNEHVVIDDDLYFFRRIEGTTRLRKTAKEDILELFKWVEAKFEEGYVHGGVSAREGNNHLQGPEKQNTRCMRFHFYRADVLRNQHFRFTDVITKQDFYCTLFLLTHGYPNVVSVEFAQNQDKGSNSAGGCSWYRDAKVMDEGAHRLAELYPDYVKVVEKFTEGAWGGGVRQDVRVQWKKAFDERPFAGDKEVE